MAKKKNHKEVLEKVANVLVDEDTIQDIITRIGDSTKESLEDYERNRERRINEMLRSAKVSLKEYEEALSYSNKGHKVTIKRDLTELYINSYNVEWIRAWDGNMDIQPCFDYHQTITYITDYFNKIDPALLEIINAFLKEDTSNSTKERMRAVANIFMTHRQIGEAEAAYRLLPNMTLKNSNVSCQWVSLGRSEDRSKRWKLATEKEMEEMESTSHLIKITGREGLWFQQQDMLDKYLRRPGMIEEICLAQFAKMYTSAGAKAKKKKDEDAIEDLEECAEDDGIESSLDEDRRMRMHMLVTDKPEGQVFLPELIELSNPFPGEAKCMKKRKVPAVLRYHKSNKDRYYEEWMLKELMLYTAYRQEDLNDYEENAEEYYEEMASYIKSVKSVVMEHLEDVEEARYMVEQSKKELDLEEIGISMDVNLEQENDDCQDEGRIDHPDYEHLNADFMDEVGTNHDQKTLFKKIEIPSLSDLREETRKLDRYQREILNTFIKYAKDVVKSRRHGNSSPEPIYWIGHGGAGAGKSTVINLVTKWCHHILSQEGDEEDCPYVIRAAFTGTAASNIDGQTLHSSFGFSFDNKHYSLSDKTRDEKRRMMRKLKIVVIDEVSMVKSDMLYQIDLKLQELKERVGVPFGGVCILAFGDMLQLKPVMGKFAFQRPSNPEFHATYAAYDRWKMFNVLNLEINHRQGNDRPYAEMLNRIRVGNTTEEDVKMLKKRVRYAISKNNDLKSVNLYIVPTRKRCALYNNKFLKALEGDEILSNAIHYSATRRKFKPFIEKKDGAIGPTAFIDELVLKIGAKVIIIHNIDTSDGLTNGQLGELIAVVKTTNGKLDKLVIKPAKKGIGQRNRGQHPNLARKYPECVIVDKVTINYNIRKKSGAVGSQATLIQFPVKLAFAITAHKIQGQTIPKPLKVAFHLESVFEEAQGYVMLSRVQELDQVYIIDKFNPKKLYPSRAALNEVKRMNEKSVNKNPTKWWRTEVDTLKIATLNCAGLKAHFSDIEVDETLHQADIIHLMEISLEETDSEESFNLRGYTMFFIKVGSGKGIMTYYKKEKVSVKAAIKSSHYQVIKFQHDKIDIFNVYRSQQGHPLNLLLDIKKEMKDNDRSAIISGDFNLCYLENWSNRLIQGLLDMNFQQLVHEPTHIKGRHIDHVYLKNENLEMDTTIYRYSPYYSDHDCLCIMIDWNEG